MSTCGFRTWLHGSRESMAASFQQLHCETQIAKIQSVHHCCRKLRFYKKEFDFNVHECKMTKEKGSFDGIARIMKADYTNTSMDLKQWIKCKRHEQNRRWFCVVSLAKQHCNCAKRNKTHEHTPKKHKAIHDETHEEKHKEQITHWHTETPQSCQPRPERLEEPIHNQQRRILKRHSNTMKRCTETRWADARPTVTTSRTNRDRVCPYPWPVRQEARPSVFFKKMFYRYVRVCADGFGFTGRKKGNSAQTNSVVNRAEGHITFDISLKTAAPPTNLSMAPVEAIEEFVDLAEKQSMSPKGEKSRLWNKLLIILKHRLSFLHQKTML